MPFWQEWGFSIVQASHDALWYAILILGWPVLHLSIVFHSQTFFKVPHDEADTPLLLLTLLHLYCTAHLKITMHAEQKRKRGDEGSGVDQVAKEEHYLQVKPTAAARGHTGYLTFARRIVDDANAPVSDVPEIPSDEDGELDEWHVISISSPCLARWVVLS